MNNQALKISFNNDDNSANIADLSFINRKIQMSQNFDFLSESFLSELADIIEGNDTSYTLDVSYADGILDITLSDGNKFVINRHSASQKIWYSSPVSGGKYFAHDPQTENFLDIKTHQTIYDTVRDDLQKLGVELDVI